MGWGSNRTYQRTWCILPYPLNAVWLELIFSKIRATTQSTAPNQASSQLVFSLQWSGQHNHSSQPHCGVVGTVWLYSLDDMSPDYPNKLTASATKGCKAVALSQSVLRFQTTSHTAFLGAQQDTYLYDPSFLWSSNNSKKQQLPVTVTANQCCTVLSVFHSFDFILKLLFMCWRTFISIW